ncbi:MAG: FtsH protease activity modulator HflK [Pseudomonadota bacterium]
MAWNEPGGGRKPQDPWGNRNRSGGGGSGGDMEDVLRKLGDRLNALFGGGGGRSSSGFPIRPVAAVLAVLWALMGVYQLDPGEQGVVLRLGKFNETVGAGLHWYPWLIDDVRRANTGELLKQPLQAEMITSDQNLVGIQLTVQYRVGDARAYLLRVASAEDVLRHSTESALRHVVGNSTLNQVIGDGRANLAVEMAPRLQNYLDKYQSGLVVSQVNIIEAQPPKSVSDAFVDVVRAKEDKDRTINEAQTYANGIVPEARGKAQRMLQEAEGYKQEQIAKAEGDAARFNNLYAEYRKAPKVTRDRIYLETMQDVYSKSSKVVLDTDSKNMIYVPLEQVLGAKTEAMRPEVAAAAAAATDGAMSTATPAPERAIDRLRARREEVR